MKTLQNNFTTFNQIIRLLELGVPADSADMYIECYWCDGSNGMWRYKVDSHEMFGNRKQIGEGVGAIKPCWSVGRLIEIIDICANEDSSDDCGEEYPSTTKVMRELNMDYITYLVKSIERATELKIIDFSKLEE